MLNSNRKFIFIFLILTNQLLNGNTNINTNAYNKFQNFLNRLKLKIGNIYNDFLENKDSQRMIKCDLELLSGTIPYKLHLLINEFKTLSNDNNQIDLFINRLILYGPPGNGKTTYANLIAKQADALFFDMKGSTIVDRYQGSGANKIEEFFDYGVRQQIGTGKKVVLFIDEVDAIASNRNMTSATAHVDHETAVQTLWLNLDNIKNNPNIFVVLATNKFKDLHPTLVDRFGDNIIEIKNPDKNMRREVINFYLKKFSVAVEPNFIEEMILKTRGFSIRSIEDMIKIMKKTLISEKDVQLKSFVNNVLINSHNQKPKFDVDPRQEEIDFMRLQKRNIYLGIFVTLSSIGLNVFNFIKNRNVYNLNLDQMIQNNAG